MFAVPLEVLPRMISSKSRNCECCDRHQTNRPISSDVIRFSLDGTDTICDRDSAIEFMNTSLQHSREVLRARHGPVRNLDNHFDRVKAYFQIQRALNA